MPITRRTRTIKTTVYMSKNGREWDTADEARENNCAVAVMNLIQCNAATSGTSPISMTPDMIGEWVWKNRYAISDIIKESDDGKLSEWGDDGRPDVWGWAKTPVSGWVRSDVPTRAVPTSDHDVPRREYKDDWVQNDRRENRAEEENGGKNYNTSGGIIHP